MRVFGKSRMCFSNSRLTSSLIAAPLLARQPPLNISGELAQLSHEMVLLSLCACCVEDKSGRIASRAVLGNHR
jgi:hypothetical protein